MEIRCGVHGTLPRHDPIRHPPPLNFAARAGVMGYSQCLGSAWGMAGNQACGSGTRTENRFLTSKSVTARGRSRRLLVRTVEARPEVANHGGRESITRFIPTLKPVIETKTRELTAPQPQAHARRWPCSLSSGGLHGFGFCGESVHRKSPRGGVRIVGACSLSSQKAGTGLRPRSPNRLEYRHGEVSVHLS